MQTRSTHGKTFDVEPEPSPQRQWHIIRESAWFFARQRFLANLEEMNTPRPDMKNTLSRIKTLSTLLFLCAAFLRAQAETNTIPASPNLPVERLFQLSRLSQLTATNGDVAPATKLTSTFVKEISLTATGAKAEYGRLRAFFNSDLASPRPVTVVTPDGRSLQFRPTFLVLENRATQESLLLGEVTNTIGEVVLPDLVRWENVFDGGPAATLELRYSGNSLEQNVIISESVTGYLPGTWSLSNVVLECWTEWFDSTPSQTETRTALLRSATSAALAIQADDATISFGHSRIVAGGRAFIIGAETNSLPVSKTWVQIPVTDASPRTFLIETLDLLNAQPQMNALPAAKRTALLKPKPSRSQLLNAQASATLPKGKEDFHVVPKISPAQNSSPSHMQIARNSSAKPAGLLIDFQLINTAPVPAGIISWWPGGGDTVDVITNRNFGDLSSGASFSAAQVGQGFSFDGSSYVSIPDAPSLNPTNGLSFEAWVYLDYYDWNHAIFRKDGECSNREYMLTVSTSRAFRAHVGSTNGNYYYLDSTNTVQPGNWYHVAMTYDVASSNLSLYVNGLFNNSGLAAGAIIRTPETVYIGGSDNGCWDYDFPGVIDEPSLYGRALSGAEIKSIYDAGSAGKINPDCVAPATDAVGWWPGDGNAFDYAHTNFGVLKNGVTFAPGNVGTAFHFDGTNQYIRIADNFDLNPTNQLTIEAWVYLDHYGPGDNFVIVRKDRDCDNRQYMLSASPDGTFRAHVGTSDDGYVYLDSTTSPPVQSWCHVAETYDGTNLSLYINGELDGTAPATGEITQTSEPVCIGGTDSTSCYQYFFAGLIDEPTIYSRALSDTEIAMIYSAGCAGKCKADTDADMLTDLQEGFLGTDPNNPDTDGDGVPDGIEFFQGRNPLISGSVPDTNNVINLQVFTPLK